MLDRFVLVHVVGIDGGVFLHELEGDGHVRLGHDEAVLGVVVLDRHAGLGDLRDALQLPAFVGIAGDHDVGTGHNVLGGLDLVALAASLADDLNGDVVGVNGGSRIGLEHHFNGRVLRRHGELNDPLVHLARFILQLFSIVDFLVAVDPNLDGLRIPTFAAAPSFQNESLACFELGLFGLAVLFVGLDGGLRSGIHVKRDGKLFPFCECGQGHGQDHDQDHNGRDQSFCFH